MKAELILKKITYNWLPKCFCIGAAIILYLLGHTARLEHRTFSVPLATIEDGSLMSASSLPSYVNVTVRSESNSISSIASSDIQAVLDLSYYTKEGTYNVPVSLSLSSQVILSDPVELVVTPEVYSVKLEEKARKSVPIVVPLMGDPMHGYEVKEIKIYPQQAIISGPRSMVESCSQISTEELDLSESKDDFEEYKAVRNVNRHIEIVSPQQVKANVIFQTSLVTKTFNNCPVFFGHLAPELEIEEKPEISFTVSGAELVLEKFYPSEYTVQADCSLISQPGEYELPVVIAVQDAFKLESQSLEKVKVVVKPRPVEQNEGEQNDASVEDKKHKPKKENQQ
ncbi:YbbR-like domain-containing protein [Treponema sp.]|uniref:CdaR family protein n=1 Tax=Treponema sp. TaxID=166 RepID=UPI00298DCCD4|nr:CdaR family protein [Treponema sp.]MCR5612271.1 hypothetical protein [Treponema sp.]